MYCMNGISRPRSRNRRRNVQSLKLVRGRRGQEGARLHGHARKSLRPPVRSVSEWSISGPRLLERLEAENIELRNRVVALALQILVLRDAAQP
jgi:hypothetical protein